ncbi:MAG: hypothetical protein JW822_09110 [Spirochaetales bacterium]|nr:hypothetical protein [Spirochaetales bacterium]
MRNKITTCLFCILLGVCSSATLSANGWEFFESMEKGFSLQYPSDWEMDEYGDELRLFSSSEFADTYQDGVMFGVYTYIIEEEVTPEQALREWLDVEDEFQLEPFSESELAGEVWWYTKSHNKKRDIAAEFYVCTRGETLYIIAFGYTPAQDGPEFFPAINGILDSFQFISYEDGATGEFKYYENEEWGLSFSYPGYWEIEEYDTNVIVSSDLDIFDDEKEGAAIAVYRDAPDGIGLDEMPQTTEELWAMLKESETEFKELYKTYKEWHGIKWLYVEFVDTNDNIEAHFYMLLHEETVYMAGAIFNPPQAQEKYGEIVDEIMSSIYFSEFEDY